MKDLYNKVIQQLISSQAKALFSARGLPTVKFVDLYKGQYLNPGRFELIPLPAVLFGWQVAHDANRNNASAVISIHAVYEQLRDTSSIGQAKDNALKVFDFIDTVHELLDGLEAENTGKLILTSQSAIQEEVIETAYLLTYTCPYSAHAKDAAAKYDYTDGQAVVHVSGDLTKKLPDLNVDLQT